MHTNNDSRLCLRRAGSAPSGKTALLHDALAAMVLCAALLAALGALCGFSFAELLPALLCALVLCAVSALLTTVGHGQWFSLSVLALVLLFALLFPQARTDGASLAAGRFAATWTAQTGQLLPAPEVSGSAASQKRALAYFLCAAAALLLLLARLLVRRARSAASTLPLLLLLALILTQGKVTGGALVLLFASAALCVLDARHEAPSLRGAQSCALALCTLTAAAVFALAALPGLQSSLAAASRWAHQTVHRLQYEKSATLPEGDLSMAPDTASGAGALLVTMDTPECVYLRGFVGERFDGERWYEPDTQTLAENSQTLYWLHADGFYPQAQFARAAENQDGAFGTITVQNTGACSRYLYAPYTLLRDSCTQALPADRLQTGAVYADGARTVSYQSLSGAEAMLLPLLEHLQTDESEATAQYRRAESSYRTLVLQTALDVDEQTLRTLSPLLDECCAEYGTADTLTPEQARTSALRFLLRCFSEDVSEDMRALLPAQAAAGTSFQLATVTVLALRYYGIPARYAEGYVISEEMAAQAQPGTAIYVSDQCGRAWAEVYQDGVGWMPVDLTPGFASMAAEESGDGVHLRAPDGTSDSPDGEIREADELPEEQTHPEQADPTPAPSDAPQSRTALLWLLFALLLPALLLGLLAARRAYLLRRRERLFRAENRADAIGWLFADTARLLEQLGLERKNGSMYAVCAQAETRFGTDYAQKLREAVRQNGEALFSSHIPDETQREQARAFRSETLLLLKQNSRFFRRLRMKWLQCLY